jgi:hypothetical protein
LVGGDVVGCQPRVERKFASRILEGLTLRRGLVEPREEMGCGLDLYDDETAN